MSQQLITALRDCVSVMERELNGLAVIQPELKQAQQALASSEWNGTDLPPVGSVCEAKVLNGHGHFVWQECRVLHHHPLHATSAAIAHGHGSLLTWASDFRPIRTAEQIAAEKRVREIEVLEKDFFIIGFSSYRATAESLHRLGYRKIEGGAA